MSKKIRDPLYNYIELDGPFMRLINTPEFQRLRNIRQTSYEALYPSALHNRFVHSLGVFYLGSKAIDYFWNNVQDILSPEYRETLAPGGVPEKGAWSRIRQTFRFACLLHDVGHSPFSHTGERYYDKGIFFKDALKEALHIPADSPEGEACDGSQFCKDVRKNDDKTGAPHEAMSALIGLELCEKHKVDIDPELFVRCIIGVKYQACKGKSQEEAALLNAVIGLLNGELIDVDKLDYTIRDAYVTGYNSLSIDLDRLLAGYTLYKVKEEYHTGYKKGSLSVIENVIYANDLERRWIQNHPTVLYDGQLVDFLLGRFDAFMRKNYRPPNPGTAGKPGAIGTVFTREALSQKGMPGCNPPLKLLNDADILAYIKNGDTSEAGRHYLDRSARLKPLWKTEAVFAPLVKDLGAPLLLDIQNDFDEFLNTLRSVGEPFINQNALDFFKTQAKTDKATSLQRAIHICGIFKQFQTEAKLPDFEFMLVQAKGFRSSYQKLRTESGPVMVQLDIGYFPLDEVMSVQAKDAAANMNKNFFCVYTTKANVKAGKDLSIKFFDCLRRNYHREA